ncbi:redoxin domain-containing protein [Micrococcus lylae]|uniref:redoxin domain-containing protein n=1 Tax=Micrococcus lylae TaxID=1273 RepID=UPI000B359CDD|nr:redoxin domain-containing protein [Micrococcus lylae]
MADSPALRDCHGQSWPFPPLADPGRSATAGPDDGARPLGVWLAFLPGAFTPVCTGELAWLGELAERWAAQGVAVRAVSCDSAPVLRRAAEDLGLPEELTLLSDFWPHGAAARRFGAFDADTGRPRRISVLLDAQGMELGRVEAEPGRARSRDEHEELTDRLLGGASAAPPVTTAGR